MAKLEQPAQTEREPTERAESKQPVQEALEQLRRIREMNAQRSVYAGDLVAEARAERERQLETVLNP